MSRHKPYGKFSQQPASSRDAAAARAWMQKLSVLKDVWGVDNLRITRDLPDGGKVVVFDQGGIRKSIILNPLEREKEKPPLEPVVSFDRIPMPLSGVIDTKIGSRNRAEEAEVRLTLQTRRRLAQYNPNNPLPPEQMVLRKFHIPLGRQGQDFLPGIVGPGQVYLQSSLHFPTWYSGTMAKLVQFVAGYGRQDGATPDMDVERAKVEAAQMRLPSGVTERIRKELEGAPPLPGYYGVPPYDGEIQYNYRHTETDGVSFDSNNKPWLVRVNAGGVFVMPLPVIPATATQAFREYIESVGDEELLTVLDTFGALPSGESFPENGADFAAWRRAGVIVRVCDSADFYTHYGYTSSCGWSFNSRGTRAYNTCFNGSEAEGIIGYTYHLLLDLAPFPSMDAKQDFGEYPPEHEIHDYMAMLMRSIGNTAEGNAAFYKIKRAAVSDIAARAQGWRQRASQSAIQVEVEHWYNLDAGPMAQHTGRLSLYKSGALYLTESIQLPEPLYKGCVNPMYRWLLPEETHRILVPRFDTIVWAWFEDDDLKTLNMFYNQGSSRVSNESEPDACRNVGSWSSKTHSGSWAISGSVHATGFDFRQVLGGSTVESLTRGSDLGFERTRAWVWFSPSAQWHSVTMSRHRLYRHDTRTVSVAGESLFVAGCVPYMCRNALLFAESKWHTGRTISNSVSWGYVQDPYSYSVELANDGASYFPNPDRGKETAWVLQENYSPSLCNSFADNGPWMQVGDEVYQLVMQHQNPEHANWGWPDYLSLWHGGGTNPRLQTGTTTTREGVQSAATNGNIWFSIDNRPERIGTKVDPTGYRVESPDRNENVFYRAAMRNCFGAARFMEVEEPQGEGGMYTRRGYSVIAGDNPFPYFIGVINE